MNPGEVETLAELYRANRVQTAIEIGVNEGRTADLLLHNVPTLKRYIGIDVRPGYKFTNPVQRNECPTHPGRLAVHDKRFELRVTRSGSLGMTADDLPPVDAIFVDGDHSAHAVLHDAALAAAIVNHAGIIVFHDYHDLGKVDVRDVLDPLSAFMPMWRIEGTWFAVTSKGLNHDGEWTLPQGCKLLDGSPATLAAA